MPGLQLHQLRVTGVALSVAESIREKVDMHALTLACLLHDMGNIIKSDLTVFPEFLEPKGFEYWQSVKNEYLARYGNDEHTATESIAEEIGVPDATLEIIRNIRFSHVPRILESGSLELKITMYADQRTSPLGVVPIDARLAEGRKRYGNKPFDGGDTFTPETYKKVVDACHELEEYLSEVSGVSLPYITEEQVCTRFEALRAYVIRE